MSTLASVFGYGLLSARAAASVAGRFYYATDTQLMYRDNGSTWDTLGLAGAGTGTVTTVKDEGSNLSTAVVSLDFVGAGVAATGTTAVTVTVPGAGKELDYAENTSSVTVTATVPTFASATTLVIGNSVTYENVPYIIEFHATDMRPGTSAGDYMYVVLYDGSTEIGHVAFVRTPAAANDNAPCHGFRRYTPTAGAHTFAAKGYTNGANGSISAGAGGAGQSAPMYLRVTKV